MNEQWKTINEFSDYEVSTLGRIKNKITQKYLIGGNDKDGYIQVTLIKDGKQYCRRVSRLVAIAFINNPLHLPIVNHKDEDKTNNRIENLEWCTVLYNNTYGSRLSKTRKVVKCIETGQIYKSLSEAGKMLNIPHQNIMHSCKVGCRAGKYHWEYVKESD